MLKVRLRDFIETEIGFFAVNTYEHSRDRVFAFLRYLNLDVVGKEIIDRYNLNRGDIRELEGKRYIKISDTGKTYQILGDMYPEYLYYDERRDVLLQGVNKEHIVRILRPQERLEEILNSCQSPLEEKCKTLASILHQFGLDYRYMGVSGSILLRLNCENSDIDFVIYGMGNHRRAREVLRSIFEDREYSRYREIIKPLSEEYWRKVYEKRIKDNTITYEEFLRHEIRKYNRGVIGGTTFDLLATRDWDEIGDNWDRIYRNMGPVEIEALVVEDHYIFDNPAIYKVEDVKILDGKDKHLASSIKEVVSFTHTYAGQAFKGERIVARGKLERVITPKGEYMRVVVGTSREAFNEYIKVVS
ncbi:MAG TPA: hypothetical protein EYH15_01735 [Methanothermococcus okinawensis]|uniref:DNA polymerase beta domain protein region n=1 Tax=Methanothermococcus okinawensis TaxID=155863 RepID=A0A832ZI83_9EURY|nr:hypothetical protein [Methanococcaceae archaeon]HIP84198.1 hypothetical protein [Methanothermococcus okinawensis]HIP90992.1 hypothetical protein [Methanothermococcus okinawensis]